MNLVAVTAAPLIGAVTGSFAVTAGMRWARGEQAISGGSHCDACAVPLGFHQTLPIVSYLRMGGVCRSCGAAISRFHPVGEALGAGLALTSVVVLPTGVAVLLTGLGLCLLVAAVADLICQRLPDLTTGLVAALGGGLALWRGRDALWVGAVAAVLTAVTLLLLRKGFRAAKDQPSLGLGDVKLAAALALWLGAITPWAFALAGGLGLIQARLGSKGRTDRIAFGPALAIAGLTLGFALQAGRLGGLGL